MAHLMPRTETPEKESTARPGQADRSAVRAKRLHKSRFFPLGARRGVGGAFNDVCSRKTWPLPLMGGFTVTFRPETAPTGLRHDAGEIKEARSSGISSGSSGVACALSATKTLSREVIEPRAAQRRQEPAAALSRKGRRCFLHAR